VPKTQQLLQMAHGTVLLQMAHGMVLPQTAHGTVLMPPV